MNPLTIQIKAVADMILENGFRNPAVIVGPVVYIGEPHQFFFSVATKNRVKGFYTLGVGFGTNEETAIEGRALLIDILAERKSIRLHLVDDELELARISEAIWPCAKTHAMVAGIEDERFTDAPSS